MPQSGPVPIKSRKSSAKVTYFEMHDDTHDKQNACSDWSGIPINILAHPNALST